MRDYWIIDGKRYANRKAAYWAIVGNDSDNDVYHGKCVSVDVSDAHLEMAAKWDRLNGGKGIATEKVVRADWWLNHGGSFFAKTAV